MIHTRLGEYISGLLILVFHVTAGRYICQSKCARSDQERADFPGISQLKKYNMFARSSKETSATVSICRVAIVFP